MNRGEYARELAPGSQDSADVLALEPPPQIPPPATKAGWRSALRVLPMTVGGIAMGLMMLSQGHGMIAGLMGAVYALSMLAMVVASSARGGNSRAELDAARADYLAHLDQARRQLRQSHRDQCERMRSHHPAPSQLWTLIGTDQMWSRTRADPSFGSVRVGEGTQESAMRVVHDDWDASSVDPMSRNRALNLIESHRLVHHVPTAIDLVSVRHLFVTGSPDGARRLVAAMIAQIALWHSPGDVGLSFVVDPGCDTHWDWVKWLPHSRLIPDESHESMIDEIPTSSSEDESNGASMGRFATAPCRYHSHSVPGATQPLSVIVIDCPGKTIPVDAQARAGAAASPGQTSVVIEITPEVPMLNSSQAQLSVNDGALTYHLYSDQDYGREFQLGVADQLSTTSAAHFARRIARYSGQEHSTVASSQKLATPDLVRLLGIRQDLVDMPNLTSTSDAQVPLRVTPDAEVTGDRAATRQFLTVPLGVGESGDPVILDLKESAEFGMGPHGVCVGATGSGKSELLRTIVLGLAMTHRSDAVNFVLIDYKGGATFLGLEDLPHVGAVITNLESDLSLIDRMKDALTGELSRRMQVLREAGNFTKISQYQAARTLDPNLAPLPHLVVVVDEFAELVIARPDFVELFTQIGRVGRSVGVHLLLASQRFDEARLRAIDPHLSYRIALRTFSPVESRAVLGVPDAYHLPQLPGHGFIATADQLKRFIAPYVSGVEDGATSSATDAAEVDVGSVLPFRARALRIRCTKKWGWRPQPRGEEVANAGRKSLLERVVAQLSYTGHPARKLWLPALTQAPTLAELFTSRSGSDGDVSLRREGPPRDHSVWHPRLQVTQGRGLTVTNPRWWGRLSAPVGLVDLPLQQRQDPLLINLDGAAGNVAVIGAGQTGKSTVIKSAVTSFSLTHTPEELGFYLLDFGGGSLAKLQGLPHCGVVAGRARPELVRRTIRDLARLMETREGLFQASGCESIRDYRRRRHSEGFHDPFPADVVLVIDGWERFSSTHDADTVKAMAASGSGFGIHVWITGHRWSDVPPAIRDHLLTKLELSIFDPYESEIDRRAQAAIPPGIPGRGITHGGIHFIAAEAPGWVLPQGDQSASSDALVEAIAGAWTSDPAPPVRTLPELVTMKDLDAISTDEGPQDASAVGSVVAGGGSGQIRWALDEEGFAPVVYQPARDGHMIAVGDQGCGKTTWLGAMIAELTHRYRQDEAKLVIVDPRRSLARQAKSGHVIAYAATPDRIGATVSNLVEALKTRLPDHDLGPNPMVDLTPGGSPIDTVATVELSGPVQDRFSNPDPAQTNQTGTKVEPPRPAIFLVIDDYELCDGGGQHWAAGPFAALAQILPYASELDLHLIVARNIVGAGRGFYTDPLMAGIAAQLAPVLIMSGPKDEGVVIHSVTPCKLPPGRGQLVTRNQTSLVQVVWSRGEGEGG